MKKLLIILVIILVGAGGYFYLKQEKQKVDINRKPIVKIGAILPLSGDNAVVGQPVKGAIEVAIDRANSMENKYHYMAIFEDSQTSPKKAITIMNKLVSYDKADAVISIFSNIGNVISLNTEKDKIIHIGLASDPNVANGKYNFINWTMPEAESKKMVQAIKSRGYKNVILVTLNQEGSIAVADVIGKNLNEVNIKNSVMIVNPGSRDMRMDIKRAQDSGADLYVSMVYNPEAPIFIKQLREGGYNTDVTAVETFNFIEDKSMIEGQWFVDAGIKDVDLIEEIKKHNKSEVTYGVGNVYDDVMLLVKAFESADSKEDAVDELIKIKKYDGATGHIEQDENGIFHNQAVVKKIIDGKMLVVED